MYKFKGYAALWLQQVGKDNEEVTNELMVIITNNHSSNLLLELLKHVSFWDKMGFTLKL
jgi:hypothetical protein